MATIGLSRPYYAKYANSGSTITYSGGALLGKAVELSMDLDSADSNILYADNGPAESDNQFAGGTLTITTDDLLPEAAAGILGLTLQSVTNSGVSMTSPQELVFNDAQEVPYVGFGAIIKKKKDGVIKWLGLVLPKVQFSNPGISAVTQGETIDWQTSELSATIMRDDTSAHTWCRYALLESEEDAEAYVTGLLDISSAASASVYSALNKDEL